MPDTQEIKNAIVNALAAFGTKPLVEAATALLESLGYKSERRFPLTPNTAKNFVATFGKDRPLNKEHALIEDWQSVDFLFQLTDTEVRTAAGGNLEFQFEGNGRWDGAEINSFLFLAVTLAKPQYNRTQLSGITRAVNRLFNMPVIVLFRHGNTLTLAIIPHRLHKRDASEDVLEKVTLIKDIRIANPHRGHIEILFDLSFGELHEKHGFSNFVALQTAWQKTLDSSELNKRFFLEVANWYFWALHHAEFPKDAPKQDGKDHISVIRLITRLMFCWFIKEKGLIPDNLFDERNLPQILTGFAPGTTRNKASVFYKAILQNLFFATLDTETEKRGWVRDNQHFMAHSLYRHRELFQKPADALDLFKNIPFLNGGLFECLDKDHGENAKPRYERVDGFSRRSDSQPTVPDFLFFGPETAVDLSKEYGDKKFRRVKVRGLIHTFNHYKFTIAENTPIEEEIALDPELSGKVFENLLAAYNPETGATARKQTGSFYTPREIVNYMVDEALIACLKTKVEQTFLSATSESGTGIPACALEQNSPQTEMSAPLSITHRNLPHWTKPGAIYWMTFRLADAIPHDKLSAWQEQREFWLKHHPEPWSAEDWKEYDDRFGKQLDDWLDSGMGSRALARPDVREALRDCLMRFDGERLRLHAAVIMPTHVHALIEPLGTHTLSALMKAIKGASAREANKLLGVAGQFWLDESFDHIVRSETQYQRFLRYIADNPVKPRLRSTEYWLYLPQGGTGIPACASPNKTTDKNVCATLEQKLRHLFAYNDEPHKFTPAEVDALITAIDSLRTLDPAVGSGAFPMGILHKLVFILGKLDPQNEKWKEHQRQRAIRETAEATKIGDKEERQHRLEDINEVFQQNASDYGRKLYLIENCIYGVDIQPIAVQIAKMRFFISLVADQKVDDAQPNRGVRPLPNLETKFVAANTLIGIYRGQQMLRNPQIKARETELRRVRERHFLARSLSAKRKCREQDAKLRTEIADLLKTDGWDTGTARKLADWNPYNQNATASFFDPEWMFGITDGFDVLIGNPPYLESRSPAFTDSLKDQLQEAVASRWPGINVADCIPRGSDLLVYFLETAVHLVAESGNVVLITQNAWLDTEYGKKFQSFIVGRTHVSMVVDSDFKHFDSAGGPNINTVITFFQGRKPSPDKFMTFVRFHEVMQPGFFSATGEKTTRSVENADSRQYPYSSRALRVTKWGLLLSLDDVVLDLLSELQEKAKLIEQLRHCRLSIGQGLNLTSNYYVSDEQVKELAFLQKALVPIHTAADGAPFSIRNTEMHLVNAQKLSKEEILTLRSEGIKPFDPKSTSKRPPILIMPRGVGRYFCALNPAQAFSSSGVDVYSDDGRCDEDTLCNLWAILNSSLAWLLREATGRKNLGGGMLKAEAVDLKSLPLFMQLGRTDEIRNIAKTLSRRQALDSIAEIDTQEHKRLDELVFDYLKADPAKRERVITSLRQKIESRMSKSQT